MSLLQRLGGIYLHLKESKCRHNFSNKRSYVGDQTQGTSMKLYLLVDVLDCLFSTICSWLLSKRNPGMLASPSYVSWVEFVGIEYKVLDKKGADETDFHIPGFLLQT